MRDGNWELSMIDGMMGIAVFTDDRTLFNYAEAMWKERVPSYIYVEEMDGARPKPVPRGKYTYWYGESSQKSTIDLDKSVDGMTQETCRDLGHTSMGLAAMIDAAETAHVQGDELYELEQKRLVAAMEFDSHLLLKKEPVPAMVCGGTLNYSKTDTFVIGYNEYHNRLGVEMPQTKEWVEQHVENDPAPQRMFMIAFEPLTHGANAKSKK
jgi:Alginate lyase